MTSTKKDEKESTYYENVITSHEYDSIYSWILKITSLNGSTCFEGLQPIPVPIKIKYHRQFIMDLLCMKLK